MGAGGGPNCGVEKSEERNLPRKHKPNTRVDRYKFGKRVQSRWYDENGRALRNRDYEHQNAHNNHDFPHDHEWRWDGGDGERGQEPLPPDYDNFY